MSSGWNIRVWLSCIVWLVGVVVRRYIDILTIIINFYYSTCISSFLTAVYTYSVTWPYVYNINSLHAES